MATAGRDAESIMKKLVREQNYLVMMRPADPQPENPPVAQEVLRVDHHDYLVDLERRGILVAAGPCRDAEGWVRGTGLLIFRADSRADWVETLMAAMARPVRSRTGTAIERRPGSSSSSTSA